MKLKFYIQRRLGCNMMLINECCLLFYSVTKIQSDYIFSNKDFTNTIRLRKAINFEIISFSHVR